MQRVQGGAVLGSAIDPEIHPFSSISQKKVKDASAPKRPMSAYMLWLNSSRERIKGEHPGISVTEISKKAGEMWKQITKDKKEVRIFLLHSFPFPSSHHSLLPSFSHL